MHDIRQWDRRRAVLPTLQRRPWIPTDLTLTPVLRRCLEFPDCADFHPLMFVDGVIEAFVRRGGRVHEKTRVVNQTILDGRQVSVRLRLMPKHVPLHAARRYSLAALLRRNGLSRSRSHGSICELHFRMDERCHIEATWKMRGAAAVVVIRISHAEGYVRY